MSSAHEWLNLVEVSGPFLAGPVLRESFPQGLDELNISNARRLNRAYEEWREAVDSNDPELESLHDAWVAEVLSSALELDDSTLRFGESLHANGITALPEHDHTIIPNYMIVDPTHGDAPLIPVHVFPPDVDLEEIRRFDTLRCSPADRIVLQLRHLNLPVGLLTNGERWMLVHAPSSQVTSFISWYARLWDQERSTLRAFVALLGIRRSFSPEEERLPSLFKRSLEHGDEVTDALGAQVQRAVEVLVQALDRADVDRNRELLQGVTEAELYEAGLTVLMRLVFLLAAEEKGLLLLGEPRYDEFYAISTLRSQLRTETEEILERRHSAWSRLLAVFRAVYGGIDHPTLRLPALGGSLFDPDRFSFLEGRGNGTTWKSSLATPLPIDDRTVLLLLEAIQTLGGRTLSYRALDVEQIGHVYEGLLERTVKRLGDVTIELEGAKGAKNASVTLGELESARLVGGKGLLSLLLDRTGRSESALSKALALKLTNPLDARLLASCRGNQRLRDRVSAIAHLIRTDPWGYPLVHPKGAFVVVLGADRRDTGTHYTPKNLTERLVGEALLPLVYEGPSSGKPKEHWILQPSAKILDLKVCDPSMGSGAFLVQACRFLSARLVEAWSSEEADGQFVDIDGVSHKSKNGKEPMPAHDSLRIEIARRLVAEKCLYGVDLNPLAVELAKLSLWLVTLGKGRPFGFLDHNLRRGDSLVGITCLDQLTELAMEPKKMRQGRLFGKTIGTALEGALELRTQMRKLPIRDISDIASMASLDSAARAMVERPEVLADAFIATVIEAKSRRDMENRLAALGGEADQALESTKACEKLRADSQRRLASDTIDGQACDTFHWPLEFPEVFLRENPGFDSFLGNPPFLGNRLWKASHGPILSRIVEVVLGQKPGKVDLCVAFHRRVVQLLRKNGTYGLLATNNIAEGSALSVGLQTIAEEGEFFWTIKGLPWPGSAATVIAIICFTKGNWSGLRICDGAECEKISPRLQPEIGEGWEPKSLNEALYAFEGVNNSKGLAFLVTPDHEWFDQLKEEPDSLLRPYITGNDITSSALTRTERWALDIADRELDEIELNWPVAHKFLIEVVKPTRTQKALKSYKGLEGRWWQFWNNRVEQMTETGQHDKCITFCKVGKYPICMTAPSTWIFTNKVAVVKLSRSDLHLILLSSFFRSWIKYLSVQSLGGDNNTFSLSITKAFSTFPLPIQRIESSKEKLAVNFQDLLITWSTKNNSGMTGALNEIHSPCSEDETILEIRRVLWQIDKIVATAYGWSDLDLEYSLQESVDSDGSVMHRYGLPSSVQVAAISKLLMLNKEQFEQENSAQ